MNLRYRPQATMFTRKTSVREEEEKKRLRFKAKGRVKPKVIWTVRNSGNFFSEKKDKTRETTHSILTHTCVYSATYVYLARIFLTPNMCQSEAGTRECIFSRVQKPRNLPLSYAHGETKYPPGGFPPNTETNSFETDIAGFFSICVCVLTVCSHSEKGSIEAVKSHCSQDNNSFSLRPPDCPTKARAMITSKKGNLWVI